MRIRHWRFIAVVAFLPLVSAFPATCPVKLTLTPESQVHRSPTFGPTDFIFTGHDEILVSNFPSSTAVDAPLSIYSQKNGKWSYDPKASEKLPRTHHARHMLLEDIDGDAAKEVIIADHGTDKPPFPGAAPLILRKNNGRWQYDERSKTLGKDFTFNVAALNFAGTQALYKANVFGKSPFFYALEKGGWVDRSNLLPPDLGPHKLCLMTAVAEDFDRDGVRDLFLGGCDTPGNKPEQGHDRILTLRKGKFILLPADTIPPRRESRSWGTVFAKTFDENEDGKPDLLTAVHDLGFHRWKIVIYRNESRPGIVRFSDYELPLSPEPTAEGYVHSLEEMSLGSGVAVILAEVRSILRDPKKRVPAFHTRLIYRDRSGYRDVSECLPKDLRETYYAARKIPGRQRELLLVPYQGQILSLKISLPGQ